MNRTCLIPTVWLKDIIAWSQKLFSCAFTDMCSSVHDAHLHVSCSWSSSGHSLVHPSCSSPHSLPSLPLHATPRRKRHQSVCITVENRRFKNAHVITQSTMMSKLRGSCEKSLIGERWQLSTRRSCEVRQAAMFTSRVPPADGDTRLSLSATLMLWFCNDNISIGFVQYHNLAYV